VRTSSDPTLDGGSPRRGSRTSTCRAGPRRSGTSNRARPRAPADRGRDSRSSSPGQLSPASVNGVVSAPGSPSGVAQREQALARRMPDRRPHRPTLWRRPLGQLLVRQSGDRVAQLFVEVRPLDECRPYRSRHRAPPHSIAAASVPRSLGTQPLRAPTDEQRILFLSSSHRRSGVTSRCVRPIELG